MRIHGTLTRWNDDRGFGFITPAKGTTDLFVHISAFPRDGVRPHLLEIVSFEVETGADGRQKAVRIMRPAQRSAPRKYTPRSSGRLGRLATLLIGAALGIYGYSQFTKRAVVLEENDPGGEVTAERLASPATSELTPTSRYTCDGRTQCPQMHSCDEARFFIRNCPNTEMDGDGDGEPCEQQWCN